MRDTIVRKIKIHALKRVEKYTRALTVREQQLLINEVIRYYDLLYDSSLQKSSGNDRDISNFIDFSFPIAFRYLYKSYTDVEGFPLIPSTSKSIKDVEVFLNICFKAGLMENYEELLLKKILSYGTIDEKSARLSHLNKYYYIEKYEKTKSVVHSHRILNALEDNYIKGFSQLPRIIKKMEKMVYLWNNNFIGYDANPEVDHFFIRNAQLDIAQATEWDGFPQSSTFGGIEYHYFLDAVVAIESICLKHLQFVEVATKKYPNLEKRNILPLVLDYDGFVETLKYILGVSSEMASEIFDIFILDDQKKEYYNHIGAPTPLFIRISSTQLLRSFTGCIYKPIEFMLSEIKRQYSKDWDRNTNERELLFRKELYAWFNEKRFMTFDRSIDIYENGRIITDIDGCIFDKKTNDIAFIQLKWQDSIYDSTRSFTSKKKNYIEKSTKWVKDIEEWVNKASEKQIADFLHLSPQLIQKDKIKFFVIGRHNGNYSGDEKPPSNAAWCQWYNLLEIFRTQVNEEINISKLFDLIQKESPYDQKYEFETLEIRYGNFFVELIAPPYNQA
ncbi:hypothetical protein MHH60_17080 [Paenibacillus sp. FSL H7-0716]|uniref:Restriction endonuclease n=1 Tax=Paenibacillus odorifer TaxID=189426 RepID=A0AB36JB72_9BACL|nr:hypothetical protein [Paenibacillus odorifer]OME16034.1 hypothetical protein BSK47_20780 [Paenibacillus odorifer]